MLNTPRPPCSMLGYNRTITRTNINVLINTGPGAGEGRKRRGKKGNLPNTFDDDCSFIDAFLSFFGILTGQKGFRRGELPENYKMLLNKTTPRYFRGYKIKIQSLIEKQKTNTFPVATQWMTCQL